MAFEKETVCGIELTKHPVIKMPSEAEVLDLAQELGAESVSEILKRREEKIQAEQNDPYRHGYEPDSWADADKLLMSGNELLIMGGE